MPRVFTKVRTFCRLGPNWDIGGAAEYQVRIAERIFNHVRKCCPLGQNWDIGGAVEFQVRIEESYEFSRMFENVVAMVRTRI